MDGTDGESKAQHSTEETKPESMNGGFSRASSFNPPPPKPVQDKRVGSVRKNREDSVL
ncbi:hypothetical protein NC652_038887 [Populus alba x Populus x berolinensis]|nr:hypothetical protein NC652_038887 [Populus alba x Populus x berolinensis]